MANKNQKVDQWHSVVQFVRSASTSFDLSRGRDLGFIEYMRGQGKFNLRSERDFIPYLKKYLGMK